MRHRRPSRRRELLPCQRDQVRVAARRCTAHLAAPQRRRTSPAHWPAVLVQPNRIPQRVDDRPGGARVSRGHLRRGRAAVQYALRQRRRDRRGRRAVDQPGLRGKRRTRAVAGWGPDAGGQRPHGARQGALRGTARSARRDGRRGAPGRLLADDRGDRQLTTTAMSLTSPLPSSFQLASDDVHSWCASLDVPPETSAHLYATLTPDERTRSASDAPRGARALGVASMVAFIAALPALGNWACRRQTPTERSARPLRFTPGSGPIEGDRFVFIDVEEPAAAIACPMFGKGNRSPSSFPSLTLHSTHLARRRSPFGMVRL